MPDSLIGDNLDSRIPTNAPGSPRHFFERPIDTLKTETDELIQQTDQQKNFNENLRRKMPSIKINLVDSPVSSFAKRGSNKSDKFVQESNSYNNNSSEDSISMI